MKNSWNVVLLVALGLAVGGSCGGDSSAKTDGGGSGAKAGGGTGGMGGAGGTGCEYQHYFAAGGGPNVSPRCTGIGGSCATLACGCNGKIITGCAEEFAEPYAYTYSGESAPDDGAISSGTTCDPNSDAGH